MSDIDATKYLRLFRWYGFTVESLVTEGGADELTARALSQLCALSRHKVAFNEALPAEFLDNLRALERNEPEVCEFFSDPARRALFLSDLLDYLQLLKRCGG